jgi:periplasmic protein TonB
MNKRLCFIAIIAIFIFLISSKTYAQSAHSENSEIIYDAVDEPPEFPGGYDAFRKFISSNIKYPEVLKDSGVEGTVYISFVIDTLGNISSAKIEKDKAGYGFGGEALKVIEKMPPWKPAKLNGRKVKVRYTIPVKFVLK